MKQKNNQKDYIWGKRSNKKWLIIVIIVAAVIIVAVAGYLLFKKKGPSDGSNQANVNGSNEALSRRVIDGVYVSNNIANCYPVAVMIENLVSARPLSGLAKANLVYEALAEGGITRFMVVYASGLNNTEIGPVRSARSYYLDWAKELNALYVHIGGSPQALTQIPKYQIFDLNQFYNSPYFWRSKDRPGPHNLYTSSELLTYALRDKKAPKEGDFQSWKFKDDTALSNRPTEEKNIIIDFSSFNYKVEYKYNRESNDYKRYQAGQPQLDKDGSEIKAKNVVIQFVKTSLVDKERLSMETIGEGESIVFLNGQFLKGKWKKQTREDRTRFYDDKDQEIFLNAGTTWVEVVPSDRNIVYN